MLTLDKIYHAAFVLKDVIRKTGVIHAPKLNPESNIYLKTENLQVTGSFKVRGAYYKISQLTDEEKKSIGAFWGFVFKFVFGYKNQKSVSVRVADNNLKSATYFFDCPQEIEVVPEKI